MTFRRGFKAEADRVARDLRGEMGLSQTDPFDPFAAAADLCIPVYAFTKVVHDSQSIVAVLLRDGRVSAMTIFTARNRRAIFYNENRVRARVVSDISHEIAHALLFHPAHSVSDLGCAGIDRSAEEEAAHLAGLLLVPNEAALHILSAGLPPEAASRLFGVSEPMMRYRINISGARLRHARRQRRLAI
jgi:hypothetical protein